MKKLPPVALSIVGVALLGQSSIAGEVKPKPVDCYFFRGEQLEVQQTCTYRSSSWAGGGGGSLTWEDSVKTKFQWGLQGRGERLCPQKGDRPFDSMAIDGVCGTNYLRSAKTLKAISQDEGNKLSKVIQCTRVKQNSVCWIF